MSNSHESQNTCHPRITPPAPTLPIGFAMLYAASGYPVVPMYARQPGGPCDCFMGSKCLLPSGHPCKQKSTTDHDTIVRWWTELPDASVGLVTGSSAGFVCLQFGIAGDGSSNLAAFEADFGVLPAAARRPMAMGGSQFFFRVGKDDRIRSRSSLAALTNTRLFGENGHVLVPPFAATGVWPPVPPADLPELPPQLVSRLLDSTDSRDDSPFPVDVLPSPLRRLVEEGSRSLTCPVELLAVPLLVIVAAVIGASRIIQIKEDWNEPAILYCATVAKPGELKSPALDLIAEPIFARQRQLRRQHDEQFEQFERDMERHHIVQKVWENSVRKYAQGTGPEPEPAPAKPVKPIQRQLFTTDATVEATAVLLDQNPRGILLIQDELAHYFNSMDQYKGSQGSDRQFWLSLWSAKTTCVNRKGDTRPIQLDHPVVSVIGCLQPDLLEVINDHFGRDDGFLDRFMFAYPTRSRLAWSDDTVTQETRDAYAAVINTLFDLIQTESDEGCATPKTMKIAEEAHETYKAWASSHMAETSQSSFPANLAGPWSKLQGYCARLALIIHMARIASDEAEDETVDEQSITAAIALAEYFKSTARRVRVQIADDETSKQRQRIVAWIRKQGGEASIREVLRAGVGNLTTADDARLVFREMEARKMGRCRSEGRSRVVFELDRRHMG